MSAVTVDVYSDFVCPWCFIASRRLHSVIDSIPGVRIDVRHHPFVLQPDTPAEGENLHEMLRNRYGADPRSMLARVEEAAHESGIPLDFSKQPMTYDTLRAHTLMRFAEQNGMSHEISASLYDAYFLEGRNIADIDVLSEIASSHGLDADEARAFTSDASELARTQQSVEETARRGIRGVPLFILNGRQILQGAQSEETFRRALMDAAA